MGNVQCQSIRTMNIENEINNKNSKFSNLANKIYKEFDFLKTITGNNESLSIKLKLDSFDFKFMTQIYMTSHSVNSKTKLRRFIKWYQMAFNNSDKNIKNKNNKNSLYKIDENLSNFYNKKPEKFLERVSKGPPNCFRWSGWKISMKIDKIINEQVFNNLLLKDIQEEVDIQIKKDLNRTLIEEPCFNNPEIQQSLYRVLRSIAKLDSEVTYCQGMNFIAGTLLIVSDFNEVETFYMMVSMLSNCNIRGFFFDDFPSLKLFIFIFDYYFDKYIHNLKTHFDLIEMPNEVWISKWFQTLFTISLPLHVVIRLWDCLFSLGIFFMINFSISLLKSREKELIKLEEPFDIIDYFKKTYYCGNFDIEEIIDKAKKIDINFYKRQIEFEAKFKINLSSFNIVYDLNSKDCIQENSSSLNCNQILLTEGNVNCINDQSLDSLSSFMENLSEENLSEEILKEIHNLDNTFVNVHSSNINNLNISLNDCTGNETITKSNTATFRNEFIQIDEDTDENIQITQSNITRNISTHTLNLGGIRRIKND